MYMKFVIRTQWFLFNYNAFGNSIFYFVTIGACVSLKSAATVVSGRIGELQMIMVIFYRWQ